MTLHSCCSKRSSDISAAQRPFPSFGVLMRRARSCVPPPHARLHGPQTVQSCSTQSTSQLCTLQSCVSELGPHASPPLSGRTSTLRESAGHSAPRVLFCTMLRVMFWVPPWHSAGSLSGSAPSHSTWSMHSMLHSCGIQSVTTQSSTSVGPYTEENLAISPRTVFVPQICVKRISCSTAVHSPHTSSYSFSSICFSDWRSACSSVFVLRDPVASVSSTFFWLSALCHVVISPLCRFSVALHAFSFSAMMVVSSSTASLQSPHMSAMLSVRSPQSGFPSTHLFV